mmetsp:Transcript_18688/g.64329  ORF Transcript_18688/g.64329 Transcript_18688/m.64329 type:complete len:225 (+) Transcript_18688:545-1219(+)
MVHFVYNSSVRVCDVSQVRGRGPIQKRAHHAVDGSVVHVAQLRFHLAALDPHLEQILVVRIPQSAKGDLAAPGLRVDRRQVYWQKSVRRRDGGTRLENAVRLCGKVGVAADAGEVAELDLQGAQFGKDCVPASPFHISPSAVLQIRSPSGQTARRVEAACESSAEVQGLVEENPVAGDVERGYQPSKLSNSRLEDGHVARAVEPQRRPDPLLGLVELRLHAHDP